MVEDAAGRAGWKCFVPSPEFQSQILLLKHPWMQKAKSGYLRKALSRFGVAATDYPGGICRISLPRTIDETQAELLENALVSVN